MTHYDSLCFVVQLIMTHYDSLFSFVAFLLVLRLAMPADPPDFPQSKDTAFLGSLRQSLHVFVLLQ
jgi:hypothetical protein